jgi:2,3-bisphosphoglycerate-dependent phosphoglycerate mutase
MGSNGPRGTLVLVRHGRSEANIHGEFAGWLDSDLTSDGIDDAKRCGALLQQAGVTIDVGFCSYLRRSIRSLWTIIDVMDRMWIPTFKTWRLNECHCGQYTGLTLKQIIERFGQADYKRWRTRFTAAPPPLARGDPRSPALDPRYRCVDARELPMGESLEMCWRRLERYWTVEVRGAILQGKTVLVVCHGNIIRAIQKSVERLTPADTMARNIIPNGCPVVYRFAGDKVVSRQILGLAAMRKAAIACSQVI